MKADNKKIHFAIGIAHLPILLLCKTKDAVGAVCALLRNWQLGA
jgi:hypothetical protein